MSWCCTPRSASRVKLLLERKDMTWNSCAATQTSQRRDASSLPVVRLDTGSCQLVMMRSAFECCAILLDVAGCFGSPSFVNLISHQKRACGLSGPGAYLALCLPHGVGSQEEARPCCGASNRHQGDSRGEGMIGGLR